jgi:hypothetical protein
MYDTKWQQRINREGCDRYFGWYIHDRVDMEENDIPNHCSGKPQVKLQEIGEQRERMG